MGQSPMQLKKSIKNHIKENLLDYGFPDSWIICNKDSAYYFQDTINLYNHTNYYYDPSNCCNFVKWDFEGFSKFRLVETKMCIEPPTSSSYVNNLYRASWKIKGKYLYLVIDNRNMKITQMFLVCDYKEEVLWNKIHSCMVLTLKRL